MKYLGNPHLKYPVIHIAGTNGKGSTAFFLSQILSAMGLRTGLFTSPHLVDFRERVRVDNNLVDPEFIIEFWSRIRDEVYRKKATFFDVSTALALDYFKACEVDVSVIETGLGGRLDSTNIVTPELVIITPIHFDHEKQLGKNLTDIAKEKAGIFKENADVLCAPQKRQVIKTLKESLPNSSDLILADNHVSTHLLKTGLKGSVFRMRDRSNNEEFESIKLRQPGDFQVSNMALAYYAARYYLSRKKIRFTKQAFLNTVENVIWPGRLQLISEHPDIIIDVSHNYQGIKRTVSFLQKHHRGESIDLLIGILKDKNPTRIIKFLKGQFRNVTVTEPETHRRLSGEVLAQKFSQKQQEVVIIKDLHKSFEFSKSKLRTRDTLLIIGSHYLAGSYLSDSN
jgi:dihydrofolate synthase/folylpolyglutamate synthase